MDFLKKMFCCCKKSKSLDISNGDVEAKKGQNINRGADLQDEFINIDLQPVPEPSPQSNKYNMAPYLKLTLVGDGGVGKSSLILQFMYNEFVEDYEPTKADAYRKDITLQGEETKIDILDTAGQESFPAVRDGYLKHGEGFIIVFDLTSRETFESVKNHRDNILRVKMDENDIPILIVGNKKDLSDKRQVSYEEGNELAGKLGLPYLETSALTKENVDKGFSEIFIKIKQKKNRQNQQRIDASNANETMIKKDKSLKKRVGEMVSKKKRKCVIS